MLSKYNNPISCSGSPIRPIWSPHFVESPLGLAEFDISLTHDGDINTFDSIQELADYVDIDNLIRRFNNGEVDVLAKVQGFYGDLTTLPTSMRDIYDLNVKGKVLFDHLSPDIREQIGEYDDFMELSDDAINTLFGVSSTNELEEDIHDVAEE